MLVTLSVSKLGNFKLVKLLSLLNIAHILVTLLVLNLDTFKFVKLLSLANILCILVTLLVSKLEPEISKLVKALSPENIPDISVT